MNLLEHKDFVVTVKTIFDKENLCELRQITVADEVVLVEALPVETNQKIVEDLKDILKKGIKKMSEEKNMCIVPIIAIPPKQERKKQKELTSKKKTKPNH